jgi:hypothetical protein
MVTTLNIILIRPVRRIHRAIPGGERPAFLI